MQGTSCGCAPTSCPNRGADRVLKPVTMAPYKNSWTTSPPPGFHLQSFTSRSVGCFSRLSSAPALATVCSQPAGPLGLGAHPWCPLPGLGPKVTGLPGRPGTPVTMLTASMQPSCLWRALLGGSFQVGLLCFIPPPCPPARFSLASTDFSVA